MSVPAIVPEDPESMCFGRSYKGVPDVFTKSVFRRVRVPGVIVCTPGDLL